MFDVPKMIRNTVLFGKIYLVLKLMSFVIPAYLAIDFILEFLVAYYR